MFFYKNASSPAIAHHLKLHSVSSFGISGILYRMTKASPHLLSHANGWWGKQLMILFIHSFRMPGLRLHHWNAALAWQPCSRHHYNSVSLIWRHAVGAFVGDFRWCLLLCEGGWLSCKNVLSEVTILSKCTDLKNTNYFSWKENINIQYTVLIGFYNEKHERTFSWILRVSMYEKNDVCLFMAVCILFVRVWTACLQMCISLCMNGCMLRACTCANLPAGQSREGRRRWRPYRSVTWNLCRSSGRIL